MQVRVAHTPLALVWPRRHLPQPRAVEAPRLHLRDRRIAAVRRVRAVSTAVETRLIPAF